MSMVGNKGHASINGHTILENADVREMSETQFSLDIEAILGGMCVRAIELVHFDCTSAVLS